jgi:hypothetical protein
LILYKDFCILKTGERIMKFDGRLFKDGKFWMAEIPALDYLTQGRTKQEALDMAVDIVVTGLDRSDVNIVAMADGKDRFVITSDNSVALIAHMLKRQRQKKGITVREVSARLGSNSPNAFGVYEQGKSAPTLEKLEELLHAIDPDTDLILRIA